MAANPYVQLAVQAARKYGLNVAVFLAQINQESGFNPNAHSSAGAEGIAQFMPGTARGMGVNPWDPRSALFGAARMMAGLVRQYGTIQQALSAYNSGRPDAYLDPHFAGGQTYNYVRTIMSAAHQKFAGAATYEHRGKPIPIEQTPVYHAAQTAASRALPPATRATQTAATPPGTSGSEIPLPGAGMIATNFVPHRDLAGVWQQIAAQPNVSPETIRYAQTAQRAAA